MNRNRLFPISQDTNNSSSLKAKNLEGFQYIPANNTGTILGIVGGVLTTIGDAIATYGAIIQLEEDTLADLRSQIKDFQDSQEADQEKEKMQEQIDDLKQKIAKLENIIMQKQS